MQKTVASIIFILIAGTCLSTILVAGQVPPGEPSRTIEVFIRPDAPDGGTGTIEEPFTNLVSARDHVRTLVSAGLDKDVVIWLREGTYFLEEPFRLDLRDSGTDEHSISYRAYPKERVVIHGGRRITGWQEQQDGTWTVKLPEVASGNWYFRQLFLNGERKHRARIPNKDEGYLFLTDILNPENRDDPINRKAFIFEPGDIRADWTNLQDVEVLKFYGWSESRLFITRVDEENNTVYLSGLSSLNPSRTLKLWGHRYLVENVFEGMDQPGEWYLNRKTGMLHYIPLEGESLEEAEFIAPVVDQLLRIEGEAEQGKYIRNLSFRDLCFYYSGAAFPEDGYHERQSDVIHPAAVYAEGVKKLVFEGNHFSRLGTHSIQMGPGCRDNRICGNRINDTGGGGILIGEQDEPESKLTRTCGNTITDNYIYDCGHIYLVGPGIWVGYSSHNHIAYNEIYHIYGNAVSVGWKWREELTAAHHNIIEYNHIHDLGRGVIGAGSGIYTLARQPGTIIRYNLIHDLVSYRDDRGRPGDRTAHPCFGLQLDRGSSDMTFEYNLIYNVTDNVYKHMNTGHVVRNNIFAFSGEYVAVKRGKDRFKGSVLFQQNILVSDNGKLMGDTWLFEDCELAFNLYWDTSDQAGDFMGRSFEEWQEKGYDEHSLFADPLFADPGNGDFTLDPESPAFDLGFEPFDLSTVGPRE